MPIPKNSDTTPDSAPTSTRTETVKRVGKAAAVRLGARQFVALARAPFVAFLSSQAKADAGLIRHIASFAEGELGEAAMSALLSVVLPYMPVPKGYEAAREALIEELRVRAFEVAGNFVVEFATGPLREVAMAFLSSGGSVSSLAPGGMLPAAVADPLHAAMASSVGVMDQFGAFSAPSIAPPQAAPANPFSGVNPFAADALRAAAGEGKNS